MSVCNPRGAAHRQPRDVQTTFGPGSASRGFMLLVIGGSMLLEKVERLIHKTPGLTATELAKMLFGLDADQSRISSECRLLAHVKRVERRGSGGPGDPYRYFPLLVA
jgi:hypothetical protein